MVSHPDNHSIVNVIVDCYEKFLCLEHQEMMSYAYPGDGCYYRLEKSKRLISFFFPDLNRFDHKMFKLFKDI